MAESSAIDLIGRVFGRRVREVDTAWCGDITYVRTWEGWLYLATVIDLESRRVVGFAMAQHMRASLVCDALEMAITQRRPAPGLIFHADRGSQYTSGTFRKLLTEHHITQSLSRPGQCWDNAVAESWFSTLKEELIYRQAWPTRCPGSPGHLRVYRGLLQPGTAAQLARQSHTHRIRTGLPQVRLTPNGSAPGSVDS